MTEKKFFATEKEQMDFYNSLSDCYFKMVSPFLKNNPKGQQWGIQWNLKSNYEAKISKPVYKTPIVSIYQFWFCPECQCKNTIFNLNRINKICTQCGLKVEIKKKEKGVGA